MELNKFIITEMEDFFEKEYRELMKIYNSEKLKKEIDDNRLFSKPPEGEELFKIIINFLIDYTESIISNYNDSNLDYKKIRDSAVNKYCNDSRFRTWVNMSAHYLLDKSLLFNKKWIEFIKKEKK